MHDAHRPVITVCTTLPDFRLIPPLDCTTRDCYVLPDFTGRTKSETPKGEGKKELLADDSENKPSILYFRIFPAIAGQLPLLIKGGPFKPHPCPSFYYAPTLALPQWSSHNIAP